jgi:hypothetical protein
MALMDLLPHRKVVEAPPPPPAPVSHKGTLHVGGMFPLEWDTADSASVVKAARTFDAAIRSGYVGMAYKPTETRGWGGSRMDGEVTRTFDPEADEIRMSLPYAGG